ncbi:MAG TPA: hypothetical protein VNS63_24490 [Blastocatellia bacterium]|nr:hypothetical protein [Blastocatellia bacterium]
MTECRLQVHNQEELQEIFSGMNETGEYFRLRKIGETMGIIDQRTVEATGAPLAVCINDCRIDSGQGASELAPVCFRVACAFAEMRWGSLSDKVRAVEESRPTPSE